MGPIRSEQCRIECNKDSIWCAPLYSLSLSPLHSNGNLDWMEAFNFKRRTRNIKTRVFMCMCQKQDKLIYNGIGGCGSKTCKNSQKAWSYSLWVFQFQDKMTNILEKKENDDMPNAISQTFDPIYFLPLSHSCVLYSS